MTFTDRRTGFFISAEEVATLDAVRILDVRFTQALEGWGINDGDAIVVYDDRHGITAARAWWTLTWAGLRSVRVLDDNGLLKPTSVLSEQYGRLGIDGSALVATGSEQDTVRV